MYASGSIHMEKRGELEKSALIMTKFSLHTWELAVHTFEVAFYNGVLTYEMNIKL